MAESKAQLEGGMILGMGIDVVEVERLDQALQRHGERLERRVFTDGELLVCRKRGDRIQALAARFAAKEACLKALGTGWAGGLAFRQIEVVRAATGAPRLQLHGPAAERAASLGVRRSHLSLTHQPGVAAAVVLLED